MAPSAPKSPTNLILFLFFYLVCNLGGGFINQFSAQTIATFWLYKKPKHIQNIGSCHSLSHHC